MTKELEYLYVLKSIQEIPFCVGKRLMVDFLRGDTDNESIKRNRLYNKPSFGSLGGYEKQELTHMIDKLITNKLVGYAKMNGNWTVLTLTDKGISEIDCPKLICKTYTNKYETIITEQEKTAFTALGPFLDKYNDNQKKAIISNSPHILCIAGAGTGKTTVLTKRIDFLATYRSINPRRILAITFTRKARQEMEKRLTCKGAAVHTFNSFCERILNNFSDIAYGRNVKVINFQERIKLFHKALSNAGFKSESAIDLYYQKKNNLNKEQLFFSFMNDCFTILDFLKADNKDIEQWTVNDDGLSQTDIRRVKMVIDSCKQINREMITNGLRDYSDQLIDCLSLLRTNKHCIPSYDYVLVDEFQDVNSTQIELLKILSPENIFAVGDPRQSIYGWRGAKIKYIFEFDQLYPDCEIISLVKNYRSAPHIVGLMNKAISHMKLPDLESTKIATPIKELYQSETIQQEYNNALKKIIECPHKDIFVLARTNKQLKEFSEILLHKGVVHYIKTEDDNNAIPEGVILATVHSIKGMEAKRVIVIGCTAFNFPCAVSDHPILDLIKVSDYDKDDEERRLFYVAISRAKEELFISYTGKITPFISLEMKKMLI